MIEVTGDFRGGDAASRERELKAEIDRLRAALEKCPCLCAYTWSLCVRCQALRGQNNVPDLLLNR